MELRETINSILINGERSPHLNCFVKICVSVAVSCLNNSKFKREIMLNMNHSFEDIAVDLIGDLFKTENGRFICFEKYFSCIDVIHTEEDILKAKLFALIYHRSNQRISKIRIEFGERFFKIEKAVNEEIKRHPDIYKQITAKEKVIIFKCEEVEIDLNKHFCNEEILLECLFCKKYKTAEIPEILKYIFEFLNSQTDFIKAYNRTGLAALITKFHRIRSDGNNFNFMGY